MKQYDCQKCTNINLTRDDYEAISKIYYVIEKEAEKRCSELEEIPLCIYYGKICTNYQPCLDCKNEKYINFKERIIP